MKHSIERILVFVFGCLLTRSLVGFAAYKTVADNAVLLRNLVGVLCLGIGSGLTYYYCSGTRAYGGEVNGLRGGRIWWNNLRPFHAVLYVAAALLLFTNSRCAWMPIAADVAFGAGAFVAHTDFS